MGAMDHHKDESSDIIELERLKEELEREAEMRAVLDQSILELKETLDDLERKNDCIENEENEWKTRYETQDELNKQLRQQIFYLQDKLQETKASIKEATRAPRDGKLSNTSALTDPTVFTVKNLEKEKKSLESELRDLEWRVDQESKSYHKANEDRRQFMLEIKAARSQMDSYKQRHKEVLQSSRLLHQSPESLRHGMVTQSSGSTSGGVRNIPPNQRIIDPRKGPIKRTAAVKHLPQMNR